MKSKLVKDLATIGATPRKSLSQNFLINPTVISKFVQLADIRSEDWVLEIGPGTGAITEQLLATGAHVFAIEKDAALARHLEQLQTADRRLHIRTADFLDFPLQALLQLSPQWKVVSNLPFQITAPILEKLCEQASLFQSATLIVQKEVGDRICASPHTKTMGSLTIFVQFYTEFGGSFPIASSSFHPQPSVESICLKLLFKHAKPPIDPAKFFPIVRKAYQQRRKMLTSTLKDLCPKLSDALQELGLSSKARPEELALKDWISLIQKLL